MSRIEHEYDSNGLARVYQDAKWCLIDKDGREVSDWYSYIEEWGSGYYKAELGAKKNILRPDGTIVLKEWHNDVFKVESKGFFIFSNTIRKSKTNPKTRYTYGVANVNGDIIFPMIFDRAHWMEKKDAIYVEINEKPYIVTLDGSLYDPARGHLPQKISIDQKDFFEKFANWVLPGLQFFYKDTDAPVIIDTTYHIGDILRAGAFVDVTTKLHRPAHRTRFLIASAHVAMLCEIDDICQHNPKVKEWNLCTLHYNSYFKVMDIYERDGVTQVFLLHIPAAAAFFIGHSEAAMNFVNEATGRETSLIEMARQSLDEKMRMDVHPRSLDKEFVERMYHPVGLDNDFYPVPLAPQNEPDEGEIAAIGSMVHKLANDADLDGFLKFEDNFPFTGTEGTVCEGCIYAKGIQGKGEGCGRLFIKSFRDRYLKGNCEYRKTDLAKPSLFEELDKYHKKIEREAIEKKCDKFALDKLKAFVEERLDGDIKRLKDYDFSDISNDLKYGDDRGLTTAPNDTMLLKSILTLAFADAWPDFTYESMDKHKYKADTINIVNTIFGIHFEDYYKALEQYDAPEELRQRVIKFGRKVNTIGNKMVLPTGLHMMRDTKPMGRGYLDVFLSEFYKMMCGIGKCNYKLLDALNLKKKEIVTFRTEENYKTIVRELMLDDFVDENCVPKKIFQGLFSWEPGIDKETYYKAANEFIDFCEPFIEKRADRIIEKLERILNSNN